MWPGWRPTDADPGADQETDQKAPPAEAANSTAVREPIT
jgi:hypothetical protein